MQHLSHGLTAGAPGPSAGSHLRELLQRPEIQHLAYVLLGTVVIGQFVSILANWIASKAVAEHQTATLFCGFKLWLFHWAYLVGAALGFGLLIPWAFSLEDRWQSIFILSGVSVLAIMAFFLIPMKVYIISLGRALGLLLLSWAVQTAAMAGMQFAARSIFFTDQQFAALREIGGANPEERQRFLERLAGNDAPDEIDRLLDDTLQPIGPRRPLAEREAAAIAIKRKLEERQRKLPPGNAPAAAAFQRQLDRYLRLLNEVKAERGAPPGAQAH